MENTDKRFTKELSIRWSDIDANFHMKHTSYYEFGAQARLDALEEGGLGMRWMQENALGPVLFREEAVFRKELRYGEKAIINIQLVKLRKSNSQFTIRHQIVKGDGTLCATITVEGAWIDMKQRKVVSLPEEAQKVINAFPRSEDFQLVD